LTTGEACGRQMVIDAAVRVAGTAGTTTAVPQRRQKLSSFAISE